MPAIPTVNEPTGDVLMLVTPLKKVGFTVSVVEVTTSCSEAEVAPVPLLGVAVTVPL